MTAPHVTRMMLERNEIADRMLKLNGFIDGEIFAGLEPIDKDLLLTQLNAMSTYYSILNIRITRASASAEAN